MEMHQIKIRWLGHAGFKLTFPDTTQNPPVEKVLYIDLWMENSKLPQDLKDNVPDDADLVLATHGHYDHAGAAPPLIKASKKENPQVASCFEIIKHFQRFCEVPEANCRPLNKGGFIDLGWVHI